MYEIPAAGWMEIVKWLLGFRKRVRVKGASMFPVLKPGEEVLYRPQYRRPVRGDIVVAWHPTVPDLRIIKRVAGINRDGSVQLKGENPFESTDFDSIPPGRIVGKVTSRFGANDGENKTPSP